MALVSRRQVAAVLSGRALLRRRDTNIPDNSCPQLRTKKATSRATTCRCTVATAPAPRPPPSLFLCGGIIIDSDESMGTPGIDSGFKSLFNAERGDMTDVAPSGCVGVGGEEGGSHTSAMIGSPRTPHLFGASVSKSSSSLPNHPASHSTQHRQGPPAAAAYSSRRTEPHPPPRHHLHHPNSHMPPQDLHVQQHKASSSSSVSLLPQRYRVVNAELMWEAATDALMQWRGRDVLPPPPSDTLKPSGAANRGGSAATASDEQRRGRGGSGGGSRSAQQTPAALWLRGRRDLVDLDEAIRRLYMIPLAYM